MVRSQHLRNKLMGPRYFSLLLGVIGRFVSEVNVV